MCLSSSDTLSQIIGEGTSQDSQSTHWDLVRDHCHHEMPLYHHKVEESNTSYYLWFQESTEFIDSNETFGEWVISEGDTTSSGIAYCSEWDLLECTAGSWSIMDRNEDSLGFALHFVVDNTMEIEQCSASIGNQNEYKNTSLSAGGMTVVVMTVILIFVLFVTGYLVYRKRMATLMKEKVKVRDEPVEDYDMMTTPRSHEVEVEVEVADNVPITTTNQ